LNALDGHGGLRSDWGGTSDERRTRDDVGGQRLVDVGEDTRGGGGVELLTSDTRWLGGTATGDLKVHALRVELSTTGGAGGVEGQDLVTDNVVTWGNAGGDLRDPGVVVGNELVGSPGTGDGGVVDETNSVNLEELEGGLVNSLAFTVAVGKVGHDWTVVRVWPGGPLELDVVTSSNDGVGLSVGSVQVADDVCAVVVGNEPVALVCRVGPANDVRRRRLVLEGWVVTSVVDTAGDNSLDVTVGGNAGGERAQEGSDLDEGHFAGRARDAKIGC